MGVQREDWIIFVNLNQHQVKSSVSDESCTSLVMLLTDVYGMKSACISRIQVMQVYHQKTHLLWCLWLFRKRLARQQTSKKELILALLIFGCVLFGCWGASGWTTSEPQRALAYTIRQVLHISWHPFTNHKMILLVPDLFSNIFSKPIKRVSFSFILFEELWNANVCFLHHKKKWSKVCL